MSISDGVDVLTIDPFLQMASRVFMILLLNELEMKMQPVAFVLISGGDLYWCHVHETGFGVRCLPGHHSLADNYWHLYHHR